MPQTSCYTTIGDCKLHYLRSGTGRKLLLGFHGYGHDAASLNVFEPYLAEEYTIFFVDLPYHGRTVWVNGTVLTPGMLSSVIRQWMKDEEMTRISLLGYSMGGRVCCSTDGLSVNPHYYFFTQTAMGKMIFASMVNGPDIYISFLGWMKKMGWVNDAQYKFVQYYAGDESARKKLGRIWPAMSGLMPDRDKVRAAIAQYKIIVNLFMGRYDNIMPPVLAENFKSGLESVQLHILDKGHRVFSPDNAGNIAQTLLS